MKGEPQTMKKEEYTKDMLLNVIASYIRMIENNAGKYNAATLDDIKHSARAVLKANGRTE